MHVALVSPHPVEPPDSGDRVRTVELAAALRELGTDVTVLAYSWNGEEPPDPGTRFVPGRPLRPPARQLWRVRLALARRGNVFALHRMPQMQARMRAALNELHPDVVDFQHSFTWFDPGRPSVVTVHNVETDRQARFGGHRPEAIAGAAALERTAVASADATVVFSELDGDRLRALATPRSLHVVPLGHDPGPRGPQPRAQLSTAAYVGSMDYQPNVEAARLLLQQWPGIQAASGLERLLLIGRRAAQQFASEGSVEVLTDVPDIRAALASADVLIVPLVSGGGVRVKIIEAFALGLPVVSTRLGIEGLGAVDGVHAIVVDGAPGLAQGLARIREQPVRQALADNARVLWEERYSPRQAATQMLDVYAAAISGHR